MSTRSAIESVATNLEESMGVRLVESHPNLGPVPKAKDSGRRPSRWYGTVPVEEVIPDPKQPRKSFDEEALKVGTRAMLQVSLDYLHTVD